LVSIKIDINTKEPFYVKKRRHWISTYHSWYSRMEWRWYNTNIVPLPNNSDQRRLSFLMMISCSEVFTSQLRIGICDSKEEKETEEEEEEEKMR